MLSPRACKALLLAVVLLAGTGRLAAQAVPNLLPFQARLTTSTGTPLSGLQTVVIRIYDLPSGGAPLWSETHSALAVNGVVALLLGSVTPLPADLFDDGDRWFAIQVGGDPEM